MAVPRSLFVFAAIGWAVAQTPDPAYDQLQRAYAALRVKQYDVAVAAFQEALRIKPDRASVYKDLGYTYLKIGEPLLAREQFASAMQLNPDDDHVALEYAFLAYETKQQIPARRVFDRVRRKGNQTAEQAFQNIDLPLAVGIERWSRAVEMEPGRFSGHEELARLAERGQSGRRRIALWQSLATPP
ncbi:MAG: tetratricopeptide repeat protein [Bryobacteraceae bacterium]